MHISTSASLKARRPRLSEKELLKSLEGIAMYTVDPWVAQIKLMNMHSADNQIIMCTCGPNDELRSSAHFVRKEHVPFSNVVLLFLLLRFVAENHFDPRMAKS